MKLIAYSAIHMVGCGWFTFTANEVMDRLGQYSDLVWNGVYLTWNVDDRRYVVKAHNWL